MRARMLPGVAIPWPAAPPIAIARSILATATVSSSYPAGRVAKLLGSYGLCRDLLAPAHATTYHSREGGGECSQGTAAGRRTGASPPAVRRHAGRWIGRPDRTAVRRFLGLSRQRDRRNGGGQAGWPPERGR